MDMLVGEAIFFQTSLPPLSIESSLKGKNLLPGSKFFPLRLDPFSEGAL